MAEEEESDAMNTGYDQRGRGRGNAPTYGFGPSTFSHERAFDIFNQFFAQFGVDTPGWFSDPFENDPFFAEPSPYNTYGHHQTYGNTWTSRRNDPLNDDFFLGSGRMDEGSHWQPGVRDTRSGEGDMGHMPSLSSLSSRDCLDGPTTATTTTTTVGIDGVKRIRKEVTVHYPNGHSITTVDEQVDTTFTRPDMPNNGTYYRRIPITKGTTCGDGGRDPAGGGGGFPSVSSCMGIRYIPTRDRGQGRRWHDKEW